MKRSVNYIGYIESIEEGMAFCILYKEDAKNALKYSIEVPVAEFKRKIKEGTGINCTSKDGKVTSVRVTRIPKMTKEDIEKSEKWAKEISQKIKWE